jgi:dihydroneopterin aldolase
VRERLHRLLREHRLKLLEAFAEAVAEIVIVEFGARWVRVKVAKPHKFDDVQAVGVQIERWASAPAAAPSQQASVLQFIGRGMVPGQA